MNTCNVEVRCPMCGKSYTIIVPHDGFIAWRNGGKFKIACQLYLMRKENP